jgi:hypothetical protein
LDIEAAVNFGEVILLNASRLWVDHPSTKNKFYSRLEEGSYRTAQTSLIFFELEREKANEQGLVPLTGIEPVF